MDQELIKLQEVESRNKWTVLQMEGCKKMESLKDTGTSVF